MAQQTVKSQLLRIAGQWPKDHIRPNHQFGEAICKIAESQAAWTQTGAAASSSSEVRDGQVMVAALDRLLSNSILRKYPLANETKRPKSMPKHYANLVDGLRRAERGEREPWYKSLFRFRK